jgi:ATP-binding cassette, subfamily A (ABC1), member 3
LLGHNGAGKSTTINLLTGLLSSNSGAIEIMGRTFPDDTDEIRKNIGLCLQYNVLYDDLTIEEHLQYYYRIKNISDALLDFEVNRIINQCALNNERGKLAKNLSGGNKRKLCLANSLIGGSKIIFLDEPSSGLDPNSRQSIWGILKSI